MGLALKFLLKILIELPILGLFIKRKKRQAGVLMALLINVISWSLFYILFFSTDIKVNYLVIGLAIGEALAFYKLLEVNWKKAFIMSLIVNSLNYYASQILPEDIFQPKPELRTTVQYGSATVY